MTRIGLGECRLLFRTRFFLVLRLPLLVWHAVDDLPRIRVGQPNALRLRRLAIPAAQAVATEPGKVHQVDVLHIGALAQMVHESAKCGRLQFGASLLVELRCSHGGPPSACVWKHGASGTGSPYSAPWPGQMNAPARRSGHCSTKRWRQPIHAKSWPRTCHPSRTVGASWSAAASRPL